MKAHMNHDQYPDELIRGILNSVKTIALVGASSNEVRPSYFVLKYLSQRGYRIIGVNPGLAGQEVLGCPFYAKLSDIPEPIDVVEIFRNSEAASGIVDEALALDPLPKVIWMQLTVRNDEAAARAEAQGITVIMNRCPKIEYGRLSGEIGWTGVNSRIISSKRQIMSGKGFQKRTLAPGTNPFGAKK
jgi:predicted CoA-binding protein